MAHPTVVMVAGPNGAGKSTIAPGLLPRTLGIVDYVNADVLARGLSGFNWDRTAIKAGRLMLEQLRELAEINASFAFETTGASRSFAAWIKSWKAAGYRFLLFYVWVSDVRISIERVAIRVALGGHSIPTETIQRRWTRGIHNFFQLYKPLADEWRFYDNSRVGPAILIAKGGNNLPDTILQEPTWSHLRKIATSSP